MGRVPTVIGYDYEAGVLGGEQQLSSTHVKAVHTVAEHCVNAVMTVLHGGGCRKCHTKGWMGPCGPTWAAKCDKIKTESPNPETNGVT